MLKRKLKAFAAAAENIFVEYGFALRVVIVRM